MPALPVTSWDTGLALTRCWKPTPRAMFLKKAATGLLKAKFSMSLAIGPVGDRMFAPAAGLSNITTPIYPDLDDTAVVVMALDRFDRQKYRETIERGAEWVLGLQSKNGGWGAFDADNSYYYLTTFPLPITARCSTRPAPMSRRAAWHAGATGYTKDHPQVAAAIDYLRGEQEDEGCWFGRWGTNYYLWHMVGLMRPERHRHRSARPHDPPRRRMAGLQATRGRRLGRRRRDLLERHAGAKSQRRVSTPAQTSWALIALMAAGEADSEAVTRGIEMAGRHAKTRRHLGRRILYGSRFPACFYLRYHGYKSFFPQWALSRYRHLKSGNAAPVLYGM